MLHCPKKINILRPATRPPHSASPVGPDALIGPPFLIAATWLPRPKWPPTARGTLHPTHSAIPRRTPLPCRARPPGRVACLSIVRIQCRGRVSRPVSHNRRCFTSHLITSRARRPVGAIINRPPAAPAAPRIPRTARHPAVPRHPVGRGLPDASPVYQLCGYNVGAGSAGPRPNKGDAEHRTS